LEKWTKKAVPWYGLKNGLKTDNGFVLVPQNVCYINATIQALAIAFLPLTRFQVFSSENINKVFVDESNKERKNFAQSVLSLTTSLDLSSCEHRFNGTSRAAGFMMDFHKYFKKVNELLAKDNQQHIANEFEPGLMCDAGQFLRYLWNLMDETFPQSFVETCHFKCLNCTNEYSNAEPTKSNVLVVGQRQQEENSTILLTEYLSDYFAEETVSVPCDCCDYLEKEKSSGLHFESSTKGERFVVLQVKRFSNNGSKLFTKVVVDDGVAEHLCCIDSETEERIYFRVEAVICHYGSSAHSGHYITIGRKGIYNDKRVEMDNGDAFKNLLQNGFHNDFYGYLYFLVESKDNNQERSNIQG
jgi:uncharacterized UBP type Zn finger protein